MGKEDNPYAGLRSGKDLSFRGKPVLDIGGKVPRTPEIHYVLLCHEGGLPLAFGVGGGGGEKDGDFASAEKLGRLEG